MELSEDGFVSVTLPNGTSYSLSVAIGQDGYHAAVATEGAYDENWHFLNAWVRPGELLFDLGANIGTISIPASVNGLTVHAFELLDANIQHIVRSVEKNGLRGISIVMGAISDKSEFAGIAGFSAWGTVVPNALISIPTVTVDHYVRMKEIGRVDVMKIDVEGSELKALSGASATIERDHPDILIECNAVTCGNHGYSYKQLLRFISERGYDIYRLYRRKLCPWTHDDVQEVIFTDYFATWKSKEDVTARSGWPFGTLSHEDVVGSIIEQDMYGDLHKQFVIAIQSSLPQSVLDDERVVAILVKWSSLNEPATIALLAKGAE